MSEERIDRFWRMNNPILWGIILSAVFIGFYVVLAFQKNCVDEVCQFKWEEFVSAGPNEMGDTLAGIFGGLAFLWIIMTVLLQSQELREQRREIALSRKEAKRTADALAEQVKVLEDEQRQRNEARYEKLLNEILDEIALRLGKCERGVFSVEQDSLGGFVASATLNMKKEPDQTSDAYILAISYRTNRFFWELKKEFFDSGHKFDKVNGVDDFKQIVCCINEVSEIKNYLAEDQQKRLEKIRLAAVRDNIQRLVDIEMWRNPRVSFYKEPQL